MDLILVARSRAVVEHLWQAAEKTGHRILRQLATHDDLVAIVEALRPDAVVMICDEMTPGLLQRLRDLHDARPAPLLVLTRDAAPNSINAAIRAGVTTYVVDGDDPTRLDALLMVTVARYRQQERLRRELDKTKRALEDRKHVERAKGIIMRQKSLSEDQAYRSMQKLAMDRNKRMGEIAEQIIAASEVLV